MRERQTTGEQHDVLRANQQDSAMGVHEGVSCVALWRKLSRGIPSGHLIAIIISTMTQT